MVAFALFNLLFVQSVLVDVVPDDALHCAFLLGQDVLLDFLVIYIAQVLAFAADVILDVFCRGFGIIRQVLLLELPLYILFKLVSLNLILDHSAFLLELLLIVCDF